MATAGGNRRFRRNVGRVIGIAGAVWVGFSSMSLVTALLGYPDFPYGRALILIVGGFVIALAGFSLESASGRADPGGGEGLTGVREPLSPHPSDNGTDS
jgi:hypothetical protein